MFLKGVFCNYKEQFKKTENDRVKGHRTLSQVLSKRWLTFGCQHSYGHSNTVRRDLSLQVSMSKTRITLRQIDYNGQDGHTHTDTRFQVLSQYLSHLPGLGLGGTN